MCRAVHCAVEVQRAMPERNTDVRLDSRIELRIGVNLGDVIAEGDDLYGDGVNIAACIEALAMPAGCSSPIRFMIRCERLSLGVGLDRYRVSSISKDENSSARGSRYSSETSTYPLRTSGIGLQHGGVGLLDLQEKRIVRNRHHQRHHAQCADTADADDLDRCIDRPVAIEQDAAILGQRFAILCKRLPEHVHVACGTRLLGVKNGWRRVVNAGLRAGLLNQLWKR
jgi:hypothetical protein